MYDWCNKVVMTLLKVLGFCTPMTFMACYGPPPSAGMSATDDTAEEWLADDTATVSNPEIKDSMIQQQQ